MLSIYLSEVLELPDNPANVVLLYFFCDNRDEKLNTPVAVLRGWLHQLLEQQSQLKENIRRYFELPNEVPEKVSDIVPLWRVFTKILRDLNSRPILCILDGLDECMEDSLGPFLTRLRDLCSNTEDAHVHRNFKLLIVSRDRPACIETGLQEVRRLKLDPDSSNEVNKDIDRYVSSKITDLAKEGRLSKEFLSAVALKLREGARGTFLWVGFIAAELRGKTQEQVEKILQNVPKDLDAIYKRMLQQIEDKKEASLVLHWVVLSLRPLTLRELAVATNIEDSKTQSCEDRMKDRLTSYGLFVNLSTSAREAHSSPSSWLSFSSRCCRAAASAAASSR
jgi:hypothetical protein